MLDQIDHDLLQLLSMNARDSVSALAKKLGMGRTTVQARIERLERRGIIQGYTVRLGLEEEEFRVRATTLLKLAPRIMDDLVPKVLSHFEIETAILLSGRYDLKLEISAPSIAKLDEVLSQVGKFEGVLETETMIHLSRRTGVR